MNWNKWARRFHRWASLAFVAAVIVVMIAALGQDDPAEWLFYLPLPPLFTLLITGLNLFVQPYAASWRRNRRAA